jgi:hypothetical protein
MKTTKLILSLLAIATLALSSCKKESTTPSDIDPNKKGKMGLHFDNRAGSADLILNSQTYLNALGQDLNISKFNYYISNIKLINKDGTTFTYPKNDSYFLIKESNDSTQDIELENVPEGDYTGIVFTIGIDSLKNVSSLSEREKTPVLDPSTGGADMYWGWNTGYIFVKMEGISSVAPIDTASGQHPFMYHIGLYGGYQTPTINNIKEVSLSFGTSVASVRQAKTSAPEAHIFVDALKMLNGTTNIDIASSPAIMNSPYSANVANNYKEMFTLDHVHND